MKVECPNCNKVINIPGEHHPIGEEITFECPECRGTYEFDLSSKPAQDVGSESSSIPSANRLPSGEELKKRILRSVKELPPMPQTVFKTRKIIADPKSSFKDLALVLETDQAIAARVLKMANSAYYGLIGEVSSIQQASVVLGHKTIGELITVAGTSNLLGNTLEGYGLEAGDLWRHSMGVAFGSKIIATKKYPALANDAFTAGLIHDSGKLILDQYVLERKDAFQEFMADGKQTFLSAEEKILGFDHSEIASEVCKKWNVPQDLTVAIRYHHYPSKSQEQQLSFIVHIADMISMMAGLGLGIDGLLYQMDPLAMEFIGLKEDEVNDITGEVWESVEKITE